MDFPVMQIPALGGGFVIAFIAVVHVFIAHFAVGGGLFLVLTEHLAHRQNSPEILAYVKRHTKFFVLLTMVFGGLTGVGIWFAISLTSPAATLKLVQTYSFGWATEWVFFLGEIACLLVYFYTFEQMDRRRHLFVGWCYFVFGWLSLVMIDGIISSMLTPGEWLETGAFWDGFLNPSFVPSVVLRTMLGLSLAGLFAFVTASRVEDDATRKKLVRFSAGWAVWPLLLMIPSGWWYFQVLPVSVQGMILGHNNEILPLVQALSIAIPGIVVLSLFMALRLPRRSQTALACILLALGFVEVGSFEWIREAARRPYVIYGHMFSNGLPVAELNVVREQGFLKSLRWTEHKSVTPENTLDAGHDIFVNQCLSCHSVRGPLNDILPLTSKFGVVGLESQLTGQGKLNTYMPPFIGNDEERHALAQYVVNVLHSGTAPEQIRSPNPDPVDIPPFDKEKDEFVLLAWNTMGMHCISDSDPYWVLLPPANDLFCQLVRRGESPELVTEGVEIRYQVDAAFANPEQHVSFWDFSEQLFGKKLETGEGLAGNRVSGTLHLSEGQGVYEAALIPVVPYPDGGGFNPYPIFTVEAYDSESGELLAKTRTVAPTSTEMGCKNCHGGTWRVAGVAGISDQTAEDVLAVHDRINKTRLRASAEKGKPVLCQSCHPDPVLKAPGKPGMINLPAAIHGWHASYIDDESEVACGYCHPSGPEGQTRCLRGVHADIGLTCTNCHGTLADHAISLLRYDAAQKRRGAEKLLAQLRPTELEQIAEVNPRRPWVQEPDCLNCHREYMPPESVSAFNEWTEGAEGLYRMRRDEMDALYCGACHGSPHAVYPAVRENGYGPDRDNIAPLQYTHEAAPLGAGGNCSLCHVGTEMSAEDSAHHAMGFR
ncbi:cytochrome ubiquinol oxidase subunit I [Desulfobaculum bizertense]|uniref:cytochrome ubiquinol oxidase subunit I n=1 Tax=Desulfobaculum bizertense TaxID=376490 RepID=UPI001F357166|nr:cytochrome ubiquinol oxidase subunit I [Desulfobaculum bizertense]UIJ37872.1 cytochrome ubiquinol oxidase subunit I [Desulfobaculum bizertense]